MPLLVHSGTAAIDLNALDTKRDDISDLLLASLANDNTMLGLTRVGAEFADMQLFFNEDALNQFKVTVTNAQTTTSTSFTFSQSDASVLDVGHLITPDASVGSSEVIQIVSVVGTTITVTRGYGGTTAVALSANTVLRIINAPTFPNSDLGKDMTRARIVKTNYINRTERNVNIDSEQIARSRAGYVPGIPDELQYQFDQRLAELKRIMENQYLFSIAPAAGNPTNDYQTMNGLVYWLNGTVNTTSVSINGGQLSDTLTNTIVKNIFRQGADSNVMVGGPNVTERLGQLYNDRIRIPQDERGRGFFADYITPSMANPHRLINSAYLNDTFGSGAQLLVLDMNRIRIRPFIGQFLYTITAPTFRDGDAVRMLSKWSLEVRNSGTDVGYAHQLAFNLT